MRLGFHDCVGGGCDGCVDLSSPDNAGLDLPINALPSPSCNKTMKAQNWGSVGRADIWALAAHVAADVGQARSTIRENFQMGVCGTQKL